MRRHAKTKLKRARHEVMIRGPEGEQIHYDKDGKRVKSGKARTDFKGFEKYMRELQVEAAEVDPQVERLAKEIQRSDAFWEEMPPLEENESVPDDGNST